MSEEKGIYFSTAEFFILLELAGQSRCTLLDSGEIPNDTELRQAFVSLFQRKLIEPTGKDFALLGKGKNFVEIKQAPYAVSITWRQPYPRRALCYVTENALWLAELVDVILTAQYRIRRLHRREMIRWLLETGLLTLPSLTNADTKEMKALLFNSMEELSGSTALSLEKYRNGGGLVTSYEMFRRRGYKFIRIRDNGDCEVKMYTKETVKWMLKDCFGSDKYDYC